MDTNKVGQIKQILTNAGIETVIKEFPQSTHTAQEAADVIGCTIGQIAKSLIFKGKDSGKPILIIASGSNRVDASKVQEFLQEPIEKPDAAFVLEKTGFVIGGVAPIGHLITFTKIIDEDLLQYPTIWASAGTPNSVFEISPQDLLLITEAKVLNLKQE